MKLPRRKISLPRCTHFKIQRGRTNGYPSGDRKIAPLAKRSSTQNHRAHYPGSHPNIPNNELIPLISDTYVHGLPCYVYKGGLGAAFQHPIPPSFLLSSPPPLLSSSITYIYAISYALAPWCSLRRKPPTSSLGRRCTRRLKAQDAPRWSSAPGRADDTNNEYPRANCDHLACRTR